MSNDTQTDKQSFVAEKVDHYESLKDGTDNKVKTNDGDNNDVIDNNSNNTNKVAKRITRSAKLKDSGKRAVVTASTEKKSTSTKKRKSDEDSDELNASVSKSSHPKKENVTVISTEETKKLAKDADDDQRKKNVKVEADIKLDNLTITPSQPLTEITTMTTTATLTPTLTPLIKKLSKTLIDDNDNDDNNNNKRDSTKTKPQKVVDPTIEVKKLKTTSMTSAVNLPSLPFKVKLDYDEIHFKFKLSFVNTPYKLSFDAPFLGKTLGNYWMGMEELKQRLNDGKVVELLIPGKKSVTIEALRNNKEHPGLAKYSADDFTVIVPLNDFYKCLVMSEVICRPDLPIAYTRYSHEEVEQYRKDPSLFL